MSWDTDTVLGLRISFRPHNLRPLELLEGCLVQVVIQMDGLDILNRFLHWWSSYKCNGGDWIYYVIPESWRCCNLFRGNQTNPLQALCYTENKQIKEFINCWNKYTFPRPNKQSWSVIKFLGWISLPKQLEITNVTKSLKNIIIDWRVCVLMVYTTGVRHWSQPGVHWIILEGSDS